MRDDVGLFVLVDAEAKGHLVHAGLGQFLELGDDEIGVAEEAQFGIAVFVTRRQGDEFRPCFFMGFGEMDQRVDVGRSNGGGVAANRLAGAFDRCTALGKVCNY